MNISALLATLAAALMSRLQSVGGSLALSFSALLLGYTAEEKTIILNAKQFFLDTYHAKKTAGASEIDAIEGAATAALNKFAHDEQDEFHKILSGVIDFAEGALKRVAGV